MGMKNMKFAAVIVTLSAAMLCTVPATAQKDEALGRFRDWYAVAYVEGGQKICYMVSQPTVSEGDYTKRGPTYLQVTRRSGGDTADVVSIEAGYTYKRGSEVEVVIDGKAHAMFTDGQTAWAYEEKNDKTLILRMAQGAKLVVKGTSTRGTATTDRYSLMGFMAAQRAMTKACGK